MTAETFTFALVPGRYDAPVGPLDQWLKEHRPNVAGHTEVNEPRRMGEIQGHPGHFRGIQWDPHRPGHTRGNCAVSWALPDATLEDVKSRPMVLYRDSFKCTDLTYHRVGGAEVEIWAQIVVLEFPNRRRSLFSAIHMPSSVEDGGGWKTNSQRVKVLKAAARGWRRECRRVARKHNAQRVLSGDFNINGRRYFARKWFARTFPKLRAAEYARRMPRLAPTHGNRAIDRVIHSKGLKALFHDVTPPIKGYDHKPQIVTFTWDTSTRWTTRFRKIGRGRRG